MTAKSADKKIYRVFSYERLVEMFESGRNVLVRPKLWDDPLENYVLDAAHRRLSSTKGAPSRRAQAILEVKERLYGQCWTSLDESDAMWRIYSQDRTGVRVRTTVDRLLASVQHSPEAEGCPCFIGNVRYRKGDELYANLTNPDWLEAETRDARGQARSLYFKRDAFKHEREIRLVALDENGGEQDLFPYSLDPLKLIDEVVFDPRMSTELVTVFSADLRKRLGFERSIGQSTLYSVPNLETWRASS